MTDTPPTSPTAHSGAGDTNRKDSVAAVVTFWLLGVWTMMVAGVFALVAFKIKLENDAVILLGGMIATQTTLTVGAAGFWLGSSIGSKASGDALAQLAGAGPPPPSQPLSSAAPTTEPEIKP